jgi:hypothetical protein
MYYKQGLLAVGMMQFRVPKDQTFQVEIMVDLSPCSTKYHAMKT